MTSRTNSLFMASAVTLCTAYSSCVLAQDKTAEEIVRALLPGDAQTRSLRGVSVEPGKNETVPKIDLRVNFAFDSSELTNDSLLTLRALGGALQDPRLKDFNFLIVGHTDAKGSDAYNVVLSENRAKAVRDHLAFFYEVRPERLASTGHGENQLALPDDPNNELNRRVEIKNVSD